MLESRSHMKQGRPSAVFHDASDHKLERLRRQHAEGEIDGKELARIWARHVLDGSAPAGWRD